MTTIHENRFSGRTAVVTGAGSGIGLATTVRLLDEGARVVAVDVSEDRLDDLASQRGGDDLVTVAGDITAEATITRIMESAGGTVDLLANVAGVMDGFLPVAEMDDATWERVMGVNLTAPMRLMRAVIPGMIEAGSGSIVNVGSEASIRGSAAGAAYTASKHALIGLTKNTSFMYVGAGVRVNALLPGGVATNIEGAFKSDWALERVGPVLGAVLLSIATPEQIASAITWLLSDEAGNISGAVLTSDGGWSAV